MLTDVYVSICTMDIGKSTQNKHNTTANHMYMRMYCRGNYDKSTERARDEIKRYIRTSEETAFIQASGSENVHGLTKCRQKRRLFGCCDNTLRADT